MTAGFRPVATAGGIGLCSVGNQSGTKNSSFNCLSVKVAFEPATCSILSAAGADDDLDGGLTGKAQAGGGSGASAARPAVAKQNSIATPMLAQNLEFAITIFPSRVQSCFATGPWFAIRGDVDCHTELVYCRTDTPERAVHFAP
jgi:hypothetical protein